MRVHTHLLPPPLTGTEIRGGLAIVIDVLRATSVITTALASGAASVTTFADIEPARDYADGLSRAGQSPWLGGERECRPISGFDAGNSPSEYLAAVRERPVIITTTNGTRAIDSAVQSDEMWIASFLNLSAIVQAAKDTSVIHLVCSGTNGQVTLEDILLAGAILVSLRRRGVEWSGCDSSQLADALWRQTFDESRIDAQLRPRLSRQLAMGLGGRNLVRAGYEADFDRCADVDSVSVVPRRQQTQPARFRLNLPSEPMV